MPYQNNGKQHKIKNILSSTAFFYFTAAALISQRFFHLKSIIEEPMSWRQFDTEFYAYSFFKNGINLFKPSVCWMGNHRTLILEFPFISAVISVFYELFGHSIFFARIIILLFYAASAVYLYLLIKNLYYERLAKFALLVYLILPTGVYYSRAIIVDFPVLFFSLSALYYYILGFKKSKFSFITLATLLSLFGFLIKSPYQFIIYIPLLYYIVKNGNIKQLLKYLPLMVIPIVAFILWESYTISTNSSAPDWFFIPGYFKFSSMWQWYFGTAGDRLSLINWENLLRRFSSDGITYIGIPLFIIGLFVRLKDNRSSTFFYYYLAGIIVYLLLFFKLNVIHDYYQIPILVISSYFIGACLDFIYSKLKARSIWKANLITGFILISLVINGIWYTERWYYKVDNVRTISADYIRENTPGQSLVIASIDKTDPRDPRILAPAHRFGWSIRTKDLSGKLIDSLVANGANYLAVAANENLDSNLTKYLNNYKKQEFKIPDSDWKLHLYKLK
jgi:hypothetical protein